MELRHLKLIKTISDEGNIVKSAERLFLTQSALSHQLRELEKQLGVKVFIRSRNQWNLTEEGRELYLLATQVLSSIDEKLKHIKNLQSEAGGNIRLSCECFSFYELFPDFLREMKLLYPEITSEFVFEATHDPISKIESGEVDMGIVTTKPDDTLFYSVKLMSDELFMLLHRDHQLNQKKYIDTTDFKELDLLIHSLPLNTVSIYEHLLKPSKIEPKSITPIPLTELTIQMIANNEGVTCVPKWSLKNFKLPDVCVYKTITAKGFKRNLYLAMRKENMKRKHFQDFANLFAESFS